MRSIKKIHKAESAPIGDLVTNRALPTRSLDYLDPFLFLNHHGPQVYPKNNQGLPFGPHPHRGMETVTFIIDGDISHKDSVGHESVMTAGGVQWMTAGRGVIHAEVSSDEFKQEGGALEILQLWLNLPAKSKMAEPFYQGLQKNEIPTLPFDEGKATVNLISGNWEQHKAAFKSGIGVQLNTIFLKPRGKISLHAPIENNVFFYVARGKVQVNKKEVKMLDLVEFNHDAETISVVAESVSIILFGHAHPLNETVVSHGPFVMNSEKEIQEAYSDYEQGKFGTWKH